MYSDNKNNNKTQKNVPTLPDTQIKKQPEPLIHGDYEKRANESTTDILKLIKPSK